MYKRQAIGAASKTTSSQLQTSLLEETKTLTESALQLMYAAKEAGGNPKSTRAHVKVDESAILMQEAVSDLTQTLDKAGGEAGLISGMVDEIQKAMARLEETLPDEVDQTYADYQTATFDHCKAVVKHTQEMVLKSGSAPDELAGTSRELTTTYTHLVENARGALATIESTEIASRLRKTARDLGDASIDLVHSGAGVQGNPDDQASRRELADNAKVVTEKVSYIVSAIQAGAVGTQACIEAISTIMGIIGDLETTHQTHPCLLYTSPSPRD